ncbi:Bicyclomycin resistance protein [Pseudooceanicola algae]|uniref:Bcr/CflA family efflux transporter n=2 Tax=Pseudooceanicola algae TaxID=1537215 RepID=A0A418SJH6_9RHOB|nr:multidrug effflux MFS transporter [Pseudooceanicola algae]QPM91902.1 Bicyclomycin resistance protein [Pseudooceanicola algae]
MNSSDHGTPQGTRTGRTPPHLVTLVMLAGLSAMTMNIFLPSLPRIADHFQIDYKVVQLSVAAYLAASGALQLFIGPLGDRFGRRPVLLFSLVVFLLATLGCLMAPNFQVFIAFRILQAAIATGMALSRAAVRDMYEGDRAAAVMGYVTMGMSMVPMFAPMLGGVLDVWFGWQASFWLLFSFGLGVFAVTWIDLGETSKPSGLSLMRQFGEYPDLLTSPRFWGYCMAAALASGAFFAYLGGGPFVATEVFHLTPAQFGTFNATAGCGYFFGNWATARLATRVGMNRLILIGTIIITFGMILSLGLAYGEIGSHYAFFGGMVFVGLGNGMIVPSANAGMLSVRPHLAGTASGLGGAMMIGGGAALSALAGALLSPESGHFPLIWLMLACGIGGMLSILAVMRREARLAAL